MPLSLCAIADEVEAPVEVEVTPDTKVQGKSKRQEERNGQKDEHRDLECSGAGRDCLEESPTAGAEVSVILEPVQVEREERAGTADAVAEEEPDLAQGGGGGVHPGPDSGVTAWTELSARTQSFSELRDIQVRTSDCQNSNSTTTQPQNNPKITQFNERWV